MSRLRTKFSRNSASSARNGRTRHTCGRVRAKLAEIPRDYPESGQGSAEVKQATLLNNKMILIPPAWVDRVGPNPAHIVQIGQELVHTGANLSTLTEAGPILSAPLFADSGTNLRKDCRCRAQAVESNPKLAASGPHGRVWPKLPRCWPEVKGFRQASGQFMAMFFPLVVGTHRRTHSDNLHCPPPGKLMMLPLAALAQHDQDVYVFGPRWQKMGHLGARWAQFGTS